MSFHVKNRIGLSDETQPATDQMIRLLIVNADAEFPTPAFLLENSLAQRFEIQAVVSLNEALAILEQGRVDVLILDLALLPDNPLQQLERLFDMAAVTAVILIYDADSEAIVRQAMRRGAQDSIERTRLNRTSITEVVDKAVQRQRYCNRIEREYQGLRFEFGQQAQQLFNTQQQLDVEHHAYKMLKQKLAKQYTFYDTVHDIVGALIIVLDAAGRIVRFNRACREMTGYSLQEVIGKTVWDFLLVPEEVEEVKGVFSALVATKVPGCHENYWLTKQGEKRRITWANTVFPDEDGEIEYVISSGVDITERDRVAMALRKSEHELRLITDAVPVLIAYIDRDLHIRFINKAYEDQIGLSRQQVQGKHMQSVLGAPGYAQVKGYVETVLSGRRTSFELPLSQADNMVSYVTSTLVPDLEEDGAVRGFFAVSSDITKLKEAGQLERKRIIDLAHASRLATMGEMAAEIAHELNQPLTAIASYSDACLRMLRSGTGKPDEIPEVLHNISSQAGYAGEIIRRLRRFTQKCEAQWTSLDVNEVIRYVLSLLQIDSRYNDVDVEAVLADDLPMVWADSVMLEQVVLNLLHNAIEATQSAKLSSSGLVSITSSATDTHVQVTVRDNGPGLSDEQFSHLFEAFYTTKQDGSGIGLNISRSIIDNHGGKIWAEQGDKPDGAVFHFTLPINPKSVAGFTA